MGQPSLMDYMNDKVLPELNNKTEKFIENITEKDDEISELNGIVEVRYGNEIYRSWTVKLIRPSITNFLKEKYPDSLIIRGIIDITLFDNISNDIIPIEIQKTPISHDKGDGGGFAHSTFEDLIRRQVEGNIETYDKCWFFMDLEYLRFLQSGNVGKATNIDLTWLVKLMKEETLKIFAIKYDGIVKELTTKDFDFLKDISQTCQIGYDNDERVLNRNKLKIQKNLLYGYKFIQNEITQFENEFDNRSDDNKFRHSIDYFNTSNNERCKLYGNVLKSFNTLVEINNILSCNVHNNESTCYGIILGLFCQNDFNGRNKCAQIQFIDKFNIAQYFPGYIRNKQLWDYCKSKQRIFTMNEFRGIVRGTFNYEFIKKQSSMLDY